MKKQIAMAILGVSMAAALLPAQARNEKLMVSIADALQAPSALNVSAPSLPAVTPAAPAQSQGVRYKLDNSVKLYFGPQAFPSSAQKIGMRESVGKEPIINNDDIASCHATLIEALVKLQKHAKKQGANAVVNITSRFKTGPETSSATEFECHAGGFSTVVMLRGELAKIDGQ